MTVGLLCDLCGKDIKKYPFARAQLYFRENSDCVANVFFERDFCIKCIKKIENHLKEKCIR